MTEYKNFILVPHQYVFSTSVTTALHLALLLHYDIGTFVFLAYEVYFNEYHHCFDSRKIQRREMTGRQNWQQQINVTDNSSGKKGQQINGKGEKKLI